MSEPLAASILELRIAARNLWAEVAEVAGVVVRNAPMPRRWREDTLDTLYRYACATGDLEDDLEDVQRRSHR